jgi:Skp family chaperone for outer membrane proteins
MRPIIALAVASVLVALRAPVRGGELTPEPREFKPVRVAVIDISAVFENYDKKKDVEAKLKKEVEDKEKEFGDKQNELKKLQDQLKTLDEGTPQHRDLTLKVRGMEYEMKNRQKEILKELRTKQMDSLKEIRDEITADIKKYAEGLNLDLVLEKQVVGGAEGDANYFKWPFVHYAKGELDITEDIVKRLNAQYGKPAAPAGAATGKKAGAGTAGSAKGSAEPKG